MTDRVPLILDCDNTMGVPGRDVDDGLALLYLLGSPQVELLAVTCSFGNSTQEVVYRNTPWTCWPGGAGRISRCSGGPTALPTGPPRRQSFLRRPHGSGPGPCGCWSPAPPPTCWGHGQRPRLL